MKSSVLLGVCPIGKFVFSHEDALKYKTALLNKLDEWNVEYCTIDGLLPNAPLHRLPSVGVSRQIQPLTSHQELSMKRMLWSWADQPAISCRYPPPLPSDRR